MFDIKYLKEYKSRSFFFIIIVILSSVKDQPAGTEFQIFLCYIGLFTKSVNYKNNVFKTTRGT